MADEQPELFADRGAPAALKAIEEAELKYRAIKETREKELEDAIALQMLPREELPPALDGLEPKDLDARVQNAKRNLDDAEHRWASMLKLLREFDKQVDPVKRDASEKMSRTEVTDLLRFVAIYARTANENNLSMLCATVPIIDTPEEFYSAARQAFDDGLRNAIESALRESHIPDWAATALRES